MVFKINLADKSGKTFKVELESEELVGKEIKETIPGTLVLPALEGYELEITGASDKAGFPSFDDVEGTGIKRVLLTYGKGMHKRPKHEGKHKRSNNRPGGLRLRKTVRGKVISADTVQINLKIKKAGQKSLAEIFPDQNKAPEAVKPEGKAPAEEKKE